MKIKRNQRGSSLALTSCLTAALSFAGISYMSITKSSIANRQISVKSTKAFWTAESGIEMGLGVLKNMDSLPGEAILKTIVADKDSVWVNGFLLNVAISKPYPDIEEFAIISTAKDMDQKVHANIMQSGIEYDHYLNRSLSFYGLDSHIVTGLAGPSDYYGDVFMNTDFWINKDRLRDTDVKQVRFHDRVLVAGKGGFNYGQGLNGDYSQGIQIREWNGGSGGNHDYEYLDNNISKPLIRDLLDRNCFLGGVEQVEEEVLPEGVENFDVDLSSSSVYNLNLMDGIKAGDTPYLDPSGRHTPYLKFNSDGTYDFYYKLDEGGAPSENYVHAGTYVVDNSIIYSPFEIMVRGIVSGKATVATALNKDIIIDRDIIYTSNSFNPDESDPTNRILKTGQDALGLVAGGDIYLPFKPQGDSQEGSIKVCGALFALGTDTYDPQDLYCPEGGIKYDKQRYQGQGVDKYEFYGSTTARILKVGAWTNGVGRPNTVNVYDSRFQDHVRPPGIPFCKPVSGILKIRNMGTWSKVASDC
ncbi:MAG: hypothetical protein ABIA63_07895 [bacterium]